MSFFKNIFKENVNSSKEEVNETAKFYTLDKMEQFDEIDEISQTKPVVLFKHSTRCSISRMALKQFDAEFNYPEEKINWYLLDLLNPSKQIAVLLIVLILLLRQGWSLSHSMNL